MKTNQVGILTGITSFLLVIILFKTYSSSKIPSILFFAYMGVISLLISAFFYLNNNKMVIITTLLFAMGVVISIFSVGLYFLPMAIVLILLIFRS